VDYADFGRVAVVMMAWVGKAIDVGFMVLFGARPNWLK
jgi:hypothetical protein